MSTIRKVKVQYNYQRECFVLHWQKLKNDLWVDKDRDILQVNNKAEAVEYFGRLVEESDID